MVVSKAGEPVEQSGVVGPFGQVVVVVGVGVGGFEGSAFRLGPGACLDFAGGQVNVPEDVGMQGGQTPATITADLQSCGPGTMPSGVIRVLADYAQRSTADRALTRPYRSALRIIRHCT